MKIIVTILLLLSPLSLATLFVFLVEESIETTTITIENKSAIVDKGIRVYKIATKDDQSNLIEYQTYPEIWNKLIVGKTYELRIKSPTILNIVNTSKKGN